MADIEAPVIRLNEFVASYPALFKPRDPATPGAGKPKFELTSLFDLGEDFSFVTKPFLEYVKAVKPGIHAQWVAAFAKGIQNLPEKIGPYYHPFKNGDTEMTQANEPKYPGKLYIKMKSAVRPPVVKFVGGVAVPLTEDDGEIYGGVILRASVEPFFYGEGTSPLPKKGFTFRLRTVVKIRDGERFGRGAANVNSDFEGIQSEIEYQQAPSELDNV